MANKRAKLEETVTKQRQAEVLIGYRSEESRAATGLIDEWPSGVEGRRCAQRKMRRIGNSPWTSHGPGPGRQGQERPAFPEALHDFTDHNITWRAFPMRFGNWTGVWKLLDRLGTVGAFDCCSAILTGPGGAAHPMQMFDSTAIRAHVSSGAENGGKRLADQAVGSAQKSN